MIHQKVLALHIKAAPAADEAALAAIRKYTLREFAPDDLQLREYILAHNCIDRDNECFDESLLDNFVTTIPGKGVHVIHPTSWQGNGGPAEGKVYGSRTELMSLEDARILLGDTSLQLPPDRNQVKVVYASAYFAKTPDNASLLIKQDAGIAGDCSVGFVAQCRVPIQDADGRELTARRWIGPGEAQEMSLVWLGAQQGARAIKSFFQNPQPEQAIMPLTEQQITELQNKASSGEKAANQLASLKTALGDDAPLLDNVAALKTCITDAKAYKTALVDDIVVMERQLKITGDDDTSMTAAREFLADMPVDRLKAMQKGLEARLPTQHQIKGADVNRGAPGAKQAAPEGSPAANPALA